MHLNLRHAFRGVRMNIEQQRYVRDLSKCTPRSYKAREGHLVRMNTQFYLFKGFEKETF